MTQRQGFDKQINSREIDDKTQILSPYFSGTLSGAKLALLFAGYIIFHNV